RGNRGPLGRLHGEAAGRITTRPTRSPHWQRGRSLRPGSHNYTGRTRKTGNRAEREFPGKLGIGSRIRSDVGNSPTWLDLRFDDVCLVGEEASRRGRLQYDHDISRAGLRDRVPIGVAEECAMTNAAVRVGAVAAGPSGTTIWEGMRAYFAEA